MTARVVGLDLSLAGTGIAEPDGALSVVRTKPVDELGARLGQILGEVTDLELGGVDLWVIEDLPRHVAHGGPELGMVHGIVRHHLWRTGQVVALVPPASLKTYATGKGNAKKDDIRMELFKRFTLDIADNNKADAFVLRAMGLHQLGEPLAAMPESHRKALDKVVWPDPVAA